MEKSIHTDEYAALLALLRETRQTAGLTQVQLAQRLGQSQSFVSKVEVGERRLDLIQLRTICRELGTTLPEFVGQLEERLAGQQAQQQRRQP
jgi:transcriptional regulator with XRE-family HTH domain